MRRENFSLGLHLGEHSYKLTESMVKNKVQPVLWKG